MGLTIDTEKLKDMVGKAIVCASNNKLIPITSLMSVKVEGGKLTLSTTDSTNYFYVSSSDNVECEDFEVSVLAEQFTKLIQKTTSKTVEISMQENSLMVKGNGTYHFELPTDDGSPIKFPNKVPNEGMNNLGEVKKSVIDKIINYNKPSLAVGVELPALCTYYCGENVVTSDQVRICSTKEKLFSEPKLITAQLMEVLSVVSSDNITILSNNDCLVFETNTEKLYAPITQGAETYPIVPIMTLVDMDFTSNCKISRTAVNDLLERVMLFVTKYDDKSIKMTFTQEGLMFSSKQSNGVELIPYVESNNFKDFTCFIDVEYLKSQIATQTGDYLNIGYGSETAIKLITDDVIQVVALKEE